MHQLTKLKFKPEPQNGYFFTLKHRVDRLMSADNYTKNHQLYTSTVVIFLFLGFILSYLSIAWCTSIGFMFLCYGLLGIFSALIFLNITHDAAHNCLFKNRKLNNLCIYFLDLTGANSFIWKIRHINLHHPYPNVPNFDADIKQSNFVRLNSKDNYLPIHRFQYLYMGFLYFLYTLYWVFVRDFKDFFVNTFANGSKLKIESKEFYKLFFFKALYLFNFLVLPVLLTDFSFLNVLSGFLILHFVQSSIAITALLSAHVPEDAVFVDPNSNNELPHTWAEHQMITTVDFATSSSVVNILYGGFNHHVAHHLFPNINHLHYPQITKLIIETAKEFNIGYKEMGMLSAMNSHFKLLRNQGVNPMDLFEE